MNHNSLPMSLTGWKNHDCTTWNHSYSFFGDVPSEAIDPGKRSLRYDIYPHGNDGDLRRFHDVCHGAPFVMRKKI